MATPAKIAVAASVGLASIALQGCGGGGGGGSGTSTCTAMQDYGMACMSFELPNMNDDCCNLIKGAIPSTIGVMPKIPTHDDLCSKCKGQGNKEMQDELNKNCSSSVVESTHEPHFELPNLFEAWKGKSLRAQDATCSESTGDCKLIPEIP